MSCATTDVVTITPELVLASRRFPVGAELIQSGGTHFRVWAPDRKSIALVVEDAYGLELSNNPLTAERDGYFSGFVPSIGARTLYRYRLDDGPTLFPDPASRSQPS